MRQRRSSTSTRGGGARAPPPRRARRGPRPAPAGAGPARCATRHRQRRYLEARGRRRHRLDPAATLARVAGGAEQAGATRGRHRPRRTALAVPVARPRRRLRDQLGHRARRATPPMTAATVSGAPTSSPRPSGTAAGDAQHRGQRHRPHGCADVDANGWPVTGDEYDDVPPPAWRPPARRRPAVARRPPRARLSSDRSARRLPMAAAAAGPPAGPRGYNAIIVYDRAAAQAYADKYALAYNPTFARFTGADCANFASQCGRAGGMQLAFGRTHRGWWYAQGRPLTRQRHVQPELDQRRRQMSYWNVRRTDCVASISVLGKGDFVYYDWTGRRHLGPRRRARRHQQRRSEGHRRPHHRPLPRLLEAGHRSTKYKYARCAPPG